MKKHFCVSVYVYNPKNSKFLLVKHRKAGKWLQPGGHVEPNEDPEEAALRETFEETGLRVKLVGKRFPRKQDFILPLALQKKHGGRRPYSYRCCLFSLPNGKSKRSYKLRRNGGFGMVHIRSNNR